MGGRMAHTAYGISGSQYPEIPLDQATRRLGDQGLNYALVGAQTKEALEKPPAPEGPHQEDPRRQRRDDQG